MDGKVGIWMKNYSQWIFVNDYSIYRYFSLPQWFPDWIGLEYSISFIHKLDSNESSVELLYANKFGNLASHQWMKYDTIYLRTLIG